MAKLAILGFGTVGSGVLEIARRNAAGISRRLGETLEVAYICDIRDFSAHPDAALFVNSIDPVLADDTVQVVVETIGGATVAYDYVTRALSARRHVVTSNKELVATHGAELLALAKQNGVCFLFEASVGGGTPIITPMHQSLAANTIHRVAGIINGTTNFMLTKMEKQGMDFAGALAEAQALGYAETIDPSSDVDGIDACRKIAILASLAFGSHVYPQNILAKGIRPVTPADMQAAAAMGRAVKLIAFAEKGAPDFGASLAKQGEPDASQSPSRVLSDGSGATAAGAPDAPLSIGVGPMMVRRDNQLAGVEDVFNAVMVDGDMLGEVVFYGKGAGKLPTASAVVADAIDALKDGVRIHDSLFWQPAQPIEGHYLPGGTAAVYMRAADEAGAAALRALPGARALEGAPLAVVAEDVELAALPAKLAEMEKEGRAPACVMRLWD